MPLRTLRKVFRIGQAPRVSTPEALKIFERDAFRCRYCGLDGKASFENWLVLTVDFVHPRALGGHKHADNLVTACQPCNVLKGTRRFGSLEEARDYVLKRREEWRQSYRAQVLGEKKSAHG